MPCERVSDDGDDVANIARPEAGVYFREAPVQEASVHLGPASGADEGPGAVGAAPGCGLLKSVRGLGAGIFDEAAGVDEQDVRVTGVGRDGESVPAQQAEHDLGIDEVLRAAQGNGCHRERRPRAAARACVRRGGVGRPAMPRHSDQPEGLVELREVQVGLELLDGVLDFPGLAHAELA